MAAAVLPKATRATSGSATFTGSRSGLAYRLGQEIGAGGNGIVYTVSRRPELVAKLQKQPLEKYDVDKLDVLVRALTPELLTVAAWPMDLLKSGTGQVVGFVMPRILDARPLYELYSPRSRIQQFPTADFRFLVHTAANVARLFAAVHKAGFICGDVNHSNIMVRQRGTVAAVDCDSFQVGDGTRFPCLVGTELFMPPELMGRDLGVTRRTANHDNFGLAILVFHLLFMGRHPFAGRYLGRGDMPIEQAIAESRFAYSRDDGRTKMAPPPFTPPMDTVGPAVADLFERAFHPDAGKGSRPTPEAWIDALEALKVSLAPCKLLPWHHYPAPLARCPWCAIETAARIKLFGGVVKVATATIADLETLWARYLAVVASGPKLPLPVLPRKPLPRPTLRLPAQFWPDLRGWFSSFPSRLRDFASRVRGDHVFWAAGGSYFAVKYLWTDINSLVGATRTHLAAILQSLDHMPNDPALPALAAVLLVVGGPLVGSVLAAAGLGLLRVFVRPPVRMQRAAKARTARAGPAPDRHNARRMWIGASAAWTSLPPPPDVSDLTPAIEALKSRLDTLALERETAIRACAAPETAEAQLTRYLGSLRIEDAKLANIGPARCAVLRSWGIDTAADIDEARISEIPGFGKNLTDKLVVWRDARSETFVPNTAAVVDPLDVQRIDRKLASRRMKLMKELRERISEVESRMGDFLRDRDARWAQVEAAYQAMLAR